MSGRELKEDAIDSAKLQSLLRNTVAEFGVTVGERGIEQMAAHFALLLKWNRKMNLTSLTRPKEIAARHFGESLYLSKVCSELGVLPEGVLVDVGSGAGFPGLPLKAVWPTLATVLLEPNQKKAIFLKEVVRNACFAGIAIRALRLDEAVAGSSADEPRLGSRASIATMRAVAVSPESLADLRKLLRPAGTLALFLGGEDALAVKKFPGFEWNTPIAIPHSVRRVIVLGRVSAGQPNP